MNCNYLTKSYSDCETIKISFKAEYHMETPFLNQSIELSHYLK